MDSQTPDVTEANSSAAATPAPIPMKIVRVITSCPAPFERLETELPSQPSARRVSPPASLFNHVGQQPEEARAFDGLRQFALFESRHGGDAARHDLAAFRHVTLQQLDVLVVDLGRIGAGERTGLAPAKERTASAAAITTTTA